MFIWEHPDWPRFRWDAERLSPMLADAHLRQGRLLGRMEQLGLSLRGEAALLAMTEEAVKTSEIEGEILNPAGVRSSMARRLGLPEAGLVPEDHGADGIVDVLLDATRNHDAPVTTQRLFDWQAALFPAGRSGLHRIRSGMWRDDAGPMQVVSGPIGRRKIHFEAPPALRVEAEMQAFLAWFNAPLAIDGILHAAIAHLWFVTVHPFDDGNGRLARVLADVSLARSEASAQRYYSLSGEIRRERPAYYAGLEQTQRGDLDITERLLWFVTCFARTIAAAEDASDKVLKKGEFWHLHALTSMNERQKKVLNQFLDDFEGKLTARKWAAIGKCSVPTAQRDIKELLERGVLAQSSGGSKNTSYVVA